MYYHQIEHINENAKQKYPKVMSAAFDHADFISIIALSFWNHFLLLKLCTLSLIIRSFLYLFVWPGYLCSYEWFINESEM